MPGLDDADDVEKLAELRGSLEMTDGLRIPEERPHRVQSTRQSLGGSSRYHFERRPRRLVYRSFGRAERIPARSN